MKNLSALFPWIVVLAAGLYVGSKAQPARDNDGEMRLNELGRLPIVEEGRVKPLDSVARTRLIIISRRQTFEDDKGKMQPAIKWLLDVMTSDTAMVPIAKEMKIFRIEDAKLVRFLGLESKTESGAYAIADFAPRLRELFDDADRVRNLPSEERTAYDRAVVELDVKVHAFVEDLRGDSVAMKYKVFRIVNDQVLNLLGLKARPGSYRYALSEFDTKFEKLDKEADRARQRESNDRDVFDREVLDLYQHVQSYIALARGSVPLVSPPPASSTDEPWLPLGQTLAQAEGSGKENTLARAFGDMLWAYKKGDTEGFNRELATYRDEITKEKPAEVRKAAFEAYFNHLEPFYLCTLLYVGVFFLTFLSWVGWTGTLNRSAFMLALLTLVLHTAALIGRMYIQDRWFVFVTNLYSTAIFIGWISLITGLVLEGCFGNGIGLVVASVGGAITTLIAHHLAEETGDTFAQLVAVLNTNFWLATHVTIVNMGYAATFVAGLIGAIFIFRGVATPSLDRDAVKSLGQMMYGTVCFATLFSFTGTVLGGIWADQSWGRFWGWDPKENGAVLIVIWNALVLHARWAGMVKQRGMAVLTIVGSMVTGWSWFGTNQLSVGLHAYGFSKELADGLVYFWASQCVLLCVGMLPKKLWWSFAGKKI